ncbi:MAG: 5'-nucleotidase C-terminal domain-containing protein [Flavobacteriaceae bacterium]|nr:5'-nucleotidase C-terminal domain-containing protein [Flavobacteriaceae bacterium]
MFNFGGIRQSIPKGDIKVIDVFQLMPFENMLVVAELSGEQMDRFLIISKKRCLPIP